MTEIDFAAMLREERAKARQAAAPAAPAHWRVEPTTVLSEAHRLRVTAAAVPPGLPPPPSDVFYCDDWISEAEAAALRRGIGEYRDWLALPHRRLGNLGGVPHPSGLLEEPLPPFATPLVAKLQLARVFPLSPQADGGSVADAASPASVSLLATNAAARPNQCLMNEYAPSDTSGIGWHNDGPLFQPCVAIVSLGAPTVLRFRPDPAAAAAPTFGDASTTTTTTASSYSVVLRPRSLVVFASDAYTVWQHGIPPGEPRAFPDPETCLNWPAVRAAFGDAAVLGAPLPGAADQPRHSLTVRRVATVAKPHGDWTQEDKSEHSRRLAWWARAVSEKPS